MKRSEAIKFITDVLFYGKLAESARSDIRPKFTTDLAEADACAILKELEKIGMLPPLNHWSLHTDGDKADADNVRYYIWEPEDEEK